MTTLQVGLAVFCAAVGWVVTAVWGAWMISNGWSLPFGI